MNCLLVNRLSDGTRGMSDDRSNPGSSCTTRSSKSALGSFWWSSSLSGGSTTVARQLGHVGGSTFSAYLSNPPAEAVIVESMSTRKTNNVLTYAKCWLTNAASSRLQTIEHFHCQPTGFRCDNCDVKAVYNRLQHVWSGYENLGIVLRNQLSQGHVRNGE